MCQPPDRPRQRKYGHRGIAWQVVGDGKRREGEIGIDALADDFLGRLLQVGEGSRELEMSEQSGGPDIAVRIKAMPEGRQLAP